MPRDVILYTRQGCHLCDEAHEMLRRHGVQPRLVDIDADEVLRQRYDCFVPVVVIDGVERFRGGVDERLLRRLLRAGAAGREAAGGKATEFGP
jgi:glutaredoxin